MKKILILFASVPVNKSDSNWTSFGKKLNQEFVKNNQDSQVTISALTEFGYLADGFAGSKIWHLKERYDLKEFDMIVIRNAGKYRQLALCVAQYSQIHNIKLIDKFWLKNSGTGNKLACAFLRANNDLPTPATLGAKSGLSLLKALKSLKQLNKEILNKYNNSEVSDIDNFNFPLICKADKGKKGRDNYLINSKEELKSILTSKNQPEGGYVLQQFIPNDGDYRILVMGRKIKLAFFRSGDKNLSHLNNTSQGGLASKVDISELPVDLVNNAIKAAKLEKMNLAGVDVIINKLTGQHYILEVNAAPQIHSGAFLEDKITAYANYLNTEVNRTKLKLKKQITNQIIAGRVERVLLDNQHYFRAKLDSGALHNVLSCNKITEIDQKTLELELPFNRTIRVTNDFTKSVVKSTSGHTEERFVVKLTLELDHIKITDDFTLTSREHLRYQVLLGRSFLRKAHILINPSRRYLLSTKPKLVKHN